MAKTNDLKKGTRIKLKNGWEAELMDNMRGNTRYATVFGVVTEVGSIYAHNIKSYLNSKGEWEPVELTKPQKKLEASISYF